MNKEQQETLNVINEKSQRGQFLLEYILIGILVVSVYTVIKRQVDDRNLIADLFAGPWASVAKMMEDGTWRVSQGEDQVHPLATNQSRRGDTQ